MCRGFPIQLPCTSQTPFLAPSVTLCLPLALQEWNEQVKKYPMDLAGMKSLYDSVDVIGLSGESYLEG